MYIFEILIYIFFAWAMHALALESDKKYPEYENDNNWDRYIWFYIAFFTFICAFRYSLGGDYFSYARIFDEGIIVERREGEEIVWNYLVRLTCETGLGSIFGFGVCAFLQIFFIVKSCNRCKYLLITIPIALFGSRYFMDLNGAIRQMTAACFFLWYSKFIIERKLVKYIVCVILSSFMHHSALILVVFYMIPNKFCIADRRWIMIPAFLICFVAGQTPSFGNKAHYLESLTTITGYEAYSSKAMDMVSAGKTAEALSFGPMMLSYFLIALILMWSGPYLKKKYEDVIPCFNLWYNLSFIFACAYFLIANITHLFIRPVQYLELFQMMMLALLIYDLRDKSFSNKKFKYMLIGLIIIVWTNTCWDIYKNMDFPKNLVTYKSVIIKNILK